MADQRRRLILFARFPVAGKVKTRLIPALGAEGAAALHRRLVLRTLRTAHALCQSQDVELEIRFAGDDANGMQHWLGDGWRCRPQCEGDLGERMGGAFADSFREGSPATVLIGSDCPALTPETLATAFDALRTKPVVLGPATDGGYYLAGLSRMAPEVFHRVPWGTDRVLGTSLARVRESGMEATLLEPLGDVDRPDDLAAWRQMARTEEEPPVRITVIIPALNEGLRLAATIESLHANAPHEILVVDGGSTDDTACVARRAGVRVLPSKAGRARQMNAGAAQAAGQVLLFLHADTLVPGGWRAHVEGTLAQAGAAAGAFGFRIRGHFAGRRLIEWTTNLRSRRLQGPYGDQGLFLRRNLFEELGGYADVPIMEDFEFVRRLRRHGRIVTTEASARPPMAGRTSPTAA